MKSVGEIASKIWSVVQHFTHFDEILTLTFDLGQGLGTWVIECALLGCTLVPNMKSVCEIAFKVWSVAKYLTQFEEILTLPLTLTFSQGHQHLGH